MKPARGSLCSRVVLLALLALAPLPALATGSQTAADVRARGALRCGVSSDVPGFATRDASGRWSGLEADVCRAIAAAVTGSASAVEFVPLAASMRFPALLLDQVDVTLASTSWTLSREALTGVRFTAAAYIDGQGFLVPAASAARAAADLRDGEICVEKDTTHSNRLADTRALHGLTLRLRKATSLNAAAADFFAGHCAALSAERSQLSAMRLRAGVRREDYRLLPETLSREVLAPMVRSGDPGWETIVRWVVWALVIAEESGIDGATAGTGELPDYAAAWGITRDEEFTLVAQGLGVESGWLLRAVGAAGNYREIFERNLGQGSPLGLDRGPNRLPRDGGLLFTPALR